MTKSSKKYYIYELDTKKLNVISIILLLGFGLIAFLMDPNYFKDALPCVLDSYNFAIFLIMYIGYMLLHEIFHSIAYVVMGAKFKNVVYGALVEKGILYCLCKQDVSKKNILVSLLTPFFFLGIVTIIIAYIIKSPYLLFLSLFNLSGCSGDLIMFNFIRKLDKDIRFGEFDDPVAFAISSNSDISKLKCYGLNYRNSVDSLERKDMKKITISKISILFFVLMVALAVLLLLFTPAQIF